MVHGARPSRAPSWLWLLLPYLSKSIFVNASGEGPFGHGCCLGEIKRSVCLETQTLLNARAQKRINLSWYCLRSRRKADNIQPDMVSAIKTEVTAETYSKSWTVMATNVFLNFNTSEHLCWTYFLTHVTSSLCANRLCIWFLQCWPCLLDLTLLSQVWTLDTE